MSWKIRSVWLSLVAVIAVVVIPGFASAAGVPLTLNFDNGANTQPPFTNPGAAPVDSNSFAATFDLANGSALTVGANLNFNFHISANLAVSGATLSPTANLNFPTQTTPIGLAGGPLNINSTPTGSATLTLPGPVLPSQLTNASVTNLNVALVNTPTTANTTSVSLPGSGSVDLGSIFGLFDVTLPVDANFTGAGQAGISSITYQQTAGNMLMGSGTAPGAPTNETAQYLMNLGTAIPGQQNPGTLSASVAAGVNGALNLSVLGISLGSFPLNLSSALPALSTDIPLPGVATLADLNPGGYNNVHHDDLQATMGLNAGGLSLAFPVDTNGNTTIATQTTIATNLGVAMTITVQVTATLTFGILGTLQASNINYQLQDSIAGVVAPEPGSIVLLFVGLIGALPFVIRRFRRR